jgi:hypothetical protein
MRLKLRVYMLAVKYWIQGDSWRFAKDYAAALVYGFRR